MVKSREKCKVESTACFTANRKGKVGRKQRYDEAERISLINRLESKGMTQINFAKAESVCRKTIRREFFMTLKRLLRSFQCQKSEMQSGVLTFIDSKSYILD